MATIGDLLSIRRPYFWISAIGFLLASLLLIWSLTSMNKASSRGKASWDVVLPSRPPAAGDTIRTIIEDADSAQGESIEGPPANPAFTTPALDPLKPNEPDLQLVDASPLGPLPRIAEDGRRPLETYARPYDGNDTRPRIAIMVTGLGLQADATNATIHLPGAVSLMFSPYTEDLPTLFERARLAGHEVLIELPMEPSDYPTNDPGAHTLRASGTVDTNLERLNWVLSRAQGYFAVGGQGGVFAASPEAPPMMQALAERGLGMVEIDGDSLGKVGAEADLAYLSTAIRIDDPPTADSINQVLANLEVKAKREGAAFAVAEAYPVTLKQLVSWSADLEQRGIVLAPVSAILFKQQAGLNNEDQKPSIAQSDN